MATIHQIPTRDQRSWNKIERSLRDGVPGGPFEHVIEDALPRIRDHWAVLYETHQIGPEPVLWPGSLSDEQRAVLNQQTTRLVSAVQERFEHERGVALVRLMEAELRLAYVLKYGQLPASM